MPYCRCVNTGCDWEGVLFPSLAPPEQGEEVRCGSCDQRTEVITLTGVEAEPYGSALQPGE